jgi:hypothetical protein
MAREYRIYPGIGIARVGNSLDDFFLSPEIPGLGPIELDPNDGVVPVTRYKDANHALRRQAARFRVFAVDTAADGSETFSEVVEGPNVHIEWRVELANEKAAAGWFTSEVLPEDTHKLRNPDANPSDLTIKPIFGPISGPNMTVRATIEGKFKGVTVYLGELRTDHNGRLMVLGGRGAAASVPAGQPLGDGSQANGHPANTFANNWGWYDDISDGPVTAVVRVAGQPDQPVAKSAWVIVAPPDYAPYTNGITTLYDIAVQAAGVAPPARPSFQRDVLPILQAATGLHWVSDLSIWRRFSTDYATLSTIGTPVADKARKDTLALLLGIQGGALQNYHLTVNQKTVLTAWANGNFFSDFQPNPPQEPLTPAGLDRASLTQGVGGGFFPGIEAGIRMTAPQMYAGLFRITDQPFAYAGVQQIPHAGFITRTMACPWQSDFFECAMQSTTSAWWPAQRPIEVFVEHSGSQKDWMDSVATHQELVNKFGLLGVVTRSAGPDSPLVESERDPSIPHAPDV